MCAGFKVLRTDRLEDTQELYGRMQDMLRGLYGSLPRGGRDGAETLPDYAAWIARCKDSMSQTLRDVWIQMLLAAQGARAVPAARAVVSMLRFRCRVTSDRRSTAEGPHTCEQTQHTNSLCVAHRGWRGDGRGDHAALPDAHFPVPRVRRRPRRS